MICWHKFLDMLIELVGICLVMFGVIFFALSDNSSPSWKIYGTTATPVVQKGGTPPKTNGWNLKMVVSKFGFSFSNGSIFRCKMLVFGDVQICSG